MRQVSSLLFAALLACSVLSVAQAQQCQTFQTFNAPEVAPNLVRCGADSYKANSCCNTGAAKRAYNWVYEDDGCGVVGFVCATALTDIACSVNCSPNLIVTGVNYNNTRPVLPGKVVISASQAKKLFTACQGYAWCGTQQQMTSECKFLAITVKTTSKSSTTALTTQTAPDTCTLVADLNPVSFAENILGLVVHDDDTGIPALVSVPYVGGASAASSTYPSLLVLVAAFAASMLALFKSL